MFFYRASGYRILDSKRTSRSAARECRVVVATSYYVPVSILESTGGEQWTVKSNWLSEHPLGTWHGVEVNADGRVTEIDLPNYNLRGPLTSELGSLEEPVGTAAG